MADDPGRRQDLAGLVAAHPVRDLHGLEARGERVLLEPLQCPLHGGLRPGRAGEPRSDGVGQIAEARMGDAVGESPTHQLACDIRGHRGGGEQ